MDKDLSLLAIALIKEELRCRIETKDALLNLRPPRADVQMGKVIGDVINAITGAEKRIRFELEQALAEITEIEKRIEM